MAQDAAASEKAASLTSLQQSALELFASQGFEGTPMSQIAKKTGIRKSSIYAHFESKNSLYLSLVPPTLDRERRLIAGLLSPERALVSMRAYLEDIIGRQDEDPPFLRFFLRTVYTPPACLYAPIGEQAGVFYDWLRGHLAQVLASPSRPAPLVHRLADAYVGLMDSIHVMTFFRPALAIVRLDALWPMFADFLAKAG
ncbi:MAG: TetR/AcrR family transcriptional regulator [Deltaproteobacteria bacterium]|jgi:AcrR family transcriptional regulator|nr:TetR/AcrR family transcriptional regulator [Deltaproteobacteria bacterium]